MKIKKSTLNLLGIVLIVIIAGYFMLSSGNDSGGSGSNNGYVGSGEVQEITLGIKNYNYYPNTITVKAGQPVSLTLDNSVVGCYRSFVIKELGVSKYTKSPSDTINFTPTKKGTFRFACSMGMGTGTIIVE